ncbi:hypothetical protein [Stygiolobus sp. CP859M]|uniref:hypothetical protein n=1 Tax=Stygiolobus sp. CP859M TaxID=3133135 RepID=UPI00307F2197
MPCSVFATLSGSSACEWLVELETSGVSTTFAVFDENIDQDKRRLLSLSLRANGGSDEEAGLDNEEEEENNGEDIPDSLNNQNTIHYYLPHLPRPLHSFRAYPLGYFFVECVCFCYTFAFVEYVL